MCLDLDVYVEVPDYLLELMNDKNKEICKLCSRTLDIMAVRQPQLITTNTTQPLHIIFTSN